MRKVILKKAICVLLVLCLMCASSFSVYYFTERSALYADLDYMYQHPIYNFKRIWNEFNIFRYYARLPSGFDPEEINPSTIEYYLDFTHSVMEHPFFEEHPAPFPEAVVRAKYLGKSSNPEYELRGEFRFKITEVVVGDKQGTVEVGDKVQYFSKRYNLCRYSTEEYMFSYYDVGYEIGEEYLLFLLNPPGDAVNYKNDDVPYYYIQAGGICLNKLSGEYPSIKLYPGPVEYDATYFGAETKYVTADEFIELFVKAASEREFDYMCVLRGDGKDD